MKEKQKKSKEVLEDHSNQKKQEEKIFEMAIKDINGLSWSTLSPLRLDVDLNVVSMDFTNWKINFIKNFIWNNPEKLILPTTRDEAILIDLLYDNSEEIRRRFKLRKEIKKRLYCRFFKICKGFYLNSITCTHKGGEYCDKFRKFEEMEKNENPKLAPHETLILCPKCQNKTLLVSNKEEFNMCININCCYFERKQNYQDAIGYSW